jgi:hypothetical protein
MICGVFLLVGYRMMTTSGTLAVAGKFVGDDTNKGKEKFIIWSKLITGWIGQYFGVE